MSDYEITNEDLVNFLKDKIQWWKSKTGKNYQCSCYEKLMEIVNGIDEVKK